MSSIEYNENSGRLWLNEMDSNDELALNAAIAATWCSEKLDGQNGIEFAKTAENIMALQASGIMWSSDAVNVALVILCNIIRQVGHDAQPKNLP